MAQTFKVNGTSFSYLTKADWLVDPAPGALDGQTGRQRWARLRLRAPEGMPASQYDTLSALEGQVVSVDAPDYDDRNADDYITYYGADFESLSEDHDGPNLVNVVAEFLVRL